MAQPARVSAPGKVILHGEHSVVYGKKAIAVSVGLLTKVKISPDSNLKITFTDVGIDCTVPLEKLNELKASIRPDFNYEVLNANEQIPIWEDVQKILENFCDSQVSLSAIDESLKTAQRTAFQAMLFMYLSVFNKPVGLNVSIETELPVGAGLGSSASFGVALAGAMLLSAGRISPDKLSNELINRWAFVSEKFVHGSPSGVDNTVATYGSGIIFQKGKDVQFIPDFPSIRALLVNTKVPRSTKAMVAKIASLKETNAELFTKLVEEIEEVVESAIQEVKNRKRISPELITKNHECLKELGVSHPALELIVEVARQHSFSGKLTGAGGGGCAFIFVPTGTKEESVQSLKLTLENAGLELWDTQLGCPGVAIC